jgi:hypothetical protein
MSRSRDIEGTKCACTPWNHRSRGWDAAGDAFAETSAGGMDAAGMRGKHARSQVEYRERSAGVAESADSFG